jgi:hypothetical protein
MRDDSVSTQGAHLGMEARLWERAGGSLGSTGRAPESLCAASQP